MLHHLTGVHHVTVGHLRVAAAVRQRDAVGCLSTLIVVAEGARPVGGEVSVAVADAGDGHPRLGGAGVRLAKDLQPRIEHEIRVTVLHELGHYFGLDEDRLTELGYE